MKRELRKALEQERERLVQAKIATDQALRAIDTVLKNTGTSMSLSELVAPKGKARKHAVHTYRRRFAKVCKECKKDFKSKTSRAVYCSQVCRATYNNRRKVKAALAASKPATLLPGDPLRAAGH